MLLECTRAEHLGLVETQLRVSHRDLPMLWLTGQVHYGSRGFAFIVVHGVEEDTLRRRAIRAEACELLERLGHQIELQPSRDVFNIDPVRPLSKHEAMKLLSELQRLLGQNQVR